MLRAELKVLEGKHQGKLIALNVKQFLVGRETDCHLRPNSDLVSRHHCVFLIDDFTVRLRDLGSTNGTLVNGQRIQSQTMLKEGDRIDIGKLSFSLVLRAAVPVAVSPNGESAPVEDYAPVPSTFEDTAPDSRATMETSEFPTFEPEVDIEANASAPTADDRTAIINSSQGHERQSTPAVKPRRTVVEMPPNLPPPEETGVKEAPPVAKPAGAAGATPANPALMAAEVIKNRMTRRAPPG